MLYSLQKEFFCAKILAFCCKDACSFLVNKEAFIRSATFSHGKLGIVRAPFGG